MSQDRFENGADSVVEAPEAGATVTEAAEQVGVGERSVYRWLARGRQRPESRYGRFAAAIHALRAARQLPPAQRWARLDERELVLVVSRVARAGNVQRRYASVGSSSRPKARPAAEQTRS